MMGFKTKQKQTQTKKQSFIKKEHLYLFSMQSPWSSFILFFFCNVYTGGRGTASGIVGKMKFVMLRWTVSHCQGPNVHTEWSGEAVRGVRTVQISPPSPGPLSSFY